MTFNYVIKYICLATIYFLLYNFDKSCKGISDMNNHFSKMFERDIDLLIIQEFIDKRSFADLFLKQVGIADDEEYIITDTYQSLYSQEGESDITIILNRNGKRFGVFIEDKINAITMNEQSNRYFVRAETLKKQKQLDDYVVFLAAPKSYINSHKDDKNAQYSYFVSYEEMLSVIGEYNGAAEKYKADMLKFALKEKEKGYLMIEDEKVMRFWEAFTNRCKQNSSRLIITNNKKEKGADSSWIWFKTPFSKVSIVYKTNRGIVNLRVPKYANAFDAFVDAVKPLMQQDMAFEKMAGSANVTIKNEKLILDIHSNCEDNYEQIDYILSQIERLYDFTFQISKVIEI